MTEKEQAKQRAYHAKEANRIKGELNDLGTEFAPDGIVRTVLRARVEQEQLRAKGFPA